MSLKRKLILSYMLSVLIPLIIFAFMTTSLNTKVRTFITREFSTITPSSEADQTHPFERNLIATTESEPSLASSQAYINLLFNRYFDVADLLIKENGIVIYEANKEIPEDVPLHSSQFTLERNNKIYEITYQHAEFTSASKQLRNIFVERVFTSLIMFTIFHAIFIFFATKKALPDSQQLITVANNVSHGNYDFEFDTPRKDEIGDVYKAFDNMRNNLKTYENNRKELIANISHDLKTPIASIKGYVTAINDGLATTPEKMDKYLNIIYNNTMHLDNLINDLFLYSKLDVNQVEFDLKPIHLDRFLDYYVDELKLDLEERNIQVNWTMPQLNHTLVHADTLRLRQVMQNIISNSDKHFDKNDKIIDISLSETDSTLTIEITDNGKGIHEDNLPHIFKRFYRADASRNTNMGSSGLGLAIVYQIIENHQGSVYASSKKGMWTTITIELPKQGEHNG
ncbi:HAMP domain-containing histidine kinase [Acidaminobacter sp. JC074]|uniref:sensor histidine kinase n=1 Tax=Acidaminobacter sp. JC074 TaxID=2530199 RepID=UPI001F0EF3C2|nr:HAMP domain-containing sensor histidine kinase [Acidaminobacter sp. JC074]MCH4889136.1 HAMP domain-containing histidine kinase [Acidaminobacter sp. JC074]